MRTNDFDLETNRKLLVDAGFTLIEARVEEVDEPSEHEEWFWVLAGREEDR